MLCQNPTRGSDGTLILCSLVPALELDPSEFRTRERLLPSGSTDKALAEWRRYWLDSLADSGVTGLEPLRAGSWHVPTRQFTDATILGRVLAVMLERLGGVEPVEPLFDPECMSALFGGLLLCYEGRILIEPGCCCDLGNIADWREAASYRGTDWQLVWTGHPWASIRFDGEMLVLSEPHENKPPTARWKVRPDLLCGAVDAAAHELEEFALRLQPVVTSFYGEEASEAIARHLSGLTAYD